MRGEHGGRFGEKRRCHGRSRGRVVRREGRKMVRWRSHVFVQEKLLHGWKRSEDLLDSCLALVRVRVFLLLLLHLKQEVRGSRRILRLRGVGGGSFAPPLGVAPPFGFGHERRRGRRRERRRKLGQRLCGDADLEAAFEHAPPARRVLGLQEERVDEAQGALARAAVQLSGAARRDRAELVEQRGIWVGGVTVGVRFGWGWRVVVGVEMRR